jgi:hypothetical protein
MRRTLTLAALASSWACAPGEGDDTSTAPEIPPCEQPLALEAGWGEFAYVPIDDATELTMVHGPQGTWHLDLAASLTGSTPKVMVSPRVTLIDEGIVLALEQDVLYAEVVNYDEDTCAGTVPGVRAFLDDHTPTSGTILEFICDLEGRELEIEVSATELLGTATTGETGETGAITADTASDTAVPPPPTGESASSTARVVVHTDPADGC